MFFFFFSFFFFFFFFAIQVLHPHCDKFEPMHRIIKWNQNFCEHSGFIVTATELYSNQQETMYKNQGWLKINVNLTVD